MKHCILILAHNNFDQLKMLLSMLDDPRYDIYLHIDRKKSIPLDVSCKKSNLYVLKDRIDVRWGDYSLVQAEMSLFEAAYNNGPYRIYHLISGVDLPVHSVDYLYNYVEEHKDTEFIGFSNEKFDVYKDRILKYHFLTRNYKSSSNIVDALYRFIRMFFEFVINAILKRKIDFELKKGSNWVSITHDFCGYLLSKKKFIAKYFKHSCCSDELYKQSIIWNSPFRSKVNSFEDVYKSCMRLVDWKRGQPYVWGNELEKDIEILKKSDRFFVRKTDMLAYPEFVNILCENVRSEQNCDGCNF